jgi:hypothetical protein
MIEVDWRVTSIAQREALKKDMAASPDPQGKGLGASASPDPNDEGSAASASPNPRGEGSSTSAIGRGAPGDPMK